MPLFCELCFLTRLRAIYLLLPAIPGPDDREYGNANPGYMYEVHEICRISPDKLEKTISTCGSSQYSPVRMSAFVLQLASYDTDTDHFQAVTETWSQYAKHCAKPIRFAETSSIAGSIWSQVLAASLPRRDCRRSAAEL
jgi:hypothetical protein